jgi:hypothetical protein
MAEATRLKKNMASRLPSMACKISRKSTIPSKIISGRRTGRLVIW